MDSDGNHRILIPTLLAAPPPESLVENSGCGQAVRVDVDFVGGVKYDVSRYILFDFLICGCGARTSVQGEGTRPDVERVDDLPRGVCTVHLPGPRRRVHGSGLEAKARQVSGFERRVSPADGGVNPPQQSASDYCDSVTSRF